MMVHRSPIDPQLRIVIRLDDRLLHGLAALVFGVENFKAIFLGLLVKANADHRSFAIDPRDNDDAEPIPA
jgi:hypothetical protein